MYWPQFIPTGRRKGGEREVGRLYRQPEKSPNLIHMLHIPIQKGRGEVKAEIHGVLLLIIWEGGAVPRIVNFRKCIEGGEGGEMYRQVDCSFGVTTQNMLQNWGNIENDNYGDHGSDAHDAQDGDAHDEEVGRLFS